MYRIFCESYENYLKTFDEKNYRLRISMPLSLITDINKYNEEKEKESDIYKKLSDLLVFMVNNVEKFPRFKAFLWTLYSRNIEPKEYNISSEEELEEQAKIVNSFLKLAYWY